MGLIISGTTTTGVSLVTGDNPLVITSSGYVNNSAGGEFGITGPSGTAWTVMNAGTIAGKEAAISIAAVGVLVANQITGVITGGNNVIQITGSGATVSNAGVIAGQVMLGSSGTVSNLVTGTISGGSQDAIDIKGAGVVTNAGALLSSSQNGVQLAGGGATTNQITGAISGAQGGIVISGGAGTVTNLGAVIGTSQNGVFLQSGGTVTNASDSAAISGGKSGIYINGAAGIVTNAGAISGTNAYGALLRDGGGVANLSTGTISGGIDGILVEGTAAGTVSNAGEIAGASHYGVLLHDVGGVANLSTGTISGGIDGILVEGAAAGTVSNAGEISGTGTYGVELFDGGSVVNQSTGTISAPKYGIYVKGAAGTVTNAGTISATADRGIFLGDGGGVDNQSAGTISGSYNGIFITGAVGNVTNAGAVVGSTNAGIWINNGGAVTNLSTGSIYGGDAGVFITGGTATVTNFGTIVGRGDGLYFTLAATVTNAGTVVGGTSSFGVLLEGGGGVTNLSTGRISGGADGVYVEGAAGTVTNAGEVSGLSYGIDLFQGGEVVNQSTGTISGGERGIYVRGAAGTVTNAGIISGVIAAVAFGGGFADRVIVDPGAVFSGIVNGGNAIGATPASTLELASGAVQGLISGLGTQFISFAQVTIDVGAVWTLDGANTLVAGTTLTNGGDLTILDGSLADAGTVINNGQIQVDPSTATLGALTGTGQVLVGEASTLTVTGTVAAGETIAVTGGGQLDIDPATFSGQIDGLGAGGSVELTGVTDATSAGFVNGNTVAIQQSAGPTLDLTLDPSEDYVGLAVSIATVAGIEFLNVSTLSGSGPTVISQGATEAVSGAVGTELAESVSGLGGIKVTGADSLLTTATNAFTVGEASPGSLAIDVGGTVTTAVAATIANKSGASGSSVNVSGAGSEWRVTGSLIVGDAGFGSLSLSQGGTVAAGSLTLGATAGSDGVVSVAGTGTALDLTGTATIGNAAAGELSILAGASVSAAGLTIGTANAASSGNVDVEGAGSTLFIDTGGFLNIGVAGGGSGELTIGAGTTLHFAGTVVENGHASYNNNGGVIDPDAIEFTTPDNSGNGLNEYSLYVGNINAVQISAGEGVWDTPMVLTGTSVADAQNNIDNNSDVGEWQLGQGGTMVLNTNTIDVGQAIVFEDATDTLVIGQVVNGGSAGVSGVDPTVAPGAENVFQAGGFEAQIWGYQVGDRILFDNMFVASDTIVGGNTLEVFISGDATPEFLTFFNKTGNRALGVAGMEAAAAEIAADNAPCFAAGTRIATERGEVEVEGIGIGERVRVLLGGGAGGELVGEKWAEVIWVGRREVDCSAATAPKKVWPVRVAAGAFGPGCPHADVWLSPDHAVYVGDVLIPVKYLVNGSTIAQVPRDRVVYHHLELAQHNVLLARGLPAESFLDMRDGSNYANRSGPVQLYPDYSARMWEAFGCARLVVTGPELLAARALVAEFARARQAA